MLDAWFPLRHEAEHTQRLAVALRRQRLGDVDARDAAILLYIEDGHHLALSLQFAGFFRILPPAVINSSDTFTHLCPNTPERMGGCNNMHSLYSC